MRQNEALYIVDWDIPRDPQSRRRQFYRKLTKLCLKLDPKWKRSTMSVMVTRNQDLAWAAFNLATSYGRVNIYEARVLARSHV